MRFLGTLIIIAISIYLLEKIINKLLGVEKIKISETAGKKADLWGRRVILVIILCSLTFVESGSDFAKWYMGFYTVLLFGFEAILEWKYIKNSKQYFTTIILLLYTLFIFYNIESFFLLN